MTVVRIAVARFELIVEMPILAKTAVSPANSADSSAQVSHRIAYHRGKIELRHPGLAVGGRRSAGCIWPIGPIGPIGNVGYAGTRPLTVAKAMARTSSGKPALRRFAVAPRPAPCNSLHPNGRAEARLRREQNKDAFLPGTYPSSDRNVYRSAGRWCAL